MNLFGLQIVTTSTSSSEFIENSKVNAGYFPGWILDPLTRLGSKTQIYSANEISIEIFHMARLRVLGY